MSLGSDASQFSYASVCDGIGAVHVAWRPLGWHCEWTAEIDTFPSTVVEHRWGFQNRGDMTKFREWSGIDVDLLVGGTPCQAFSVAGLRRSLEDERGNLSLVFVNLMDAIDEERKRLGKPPAICVWENVPGVLSTKDNAFGCFLAGLAGEDVPLQPPGGKWSNAGCVLGPKRAVAWRVLDAQYFGVAQRRRRVFLVASARDGFSPAEVLFESESVRRDTPPSREKGQTTSGPIAGCSNGGGANGPGRTADDADSLIPIWRAGDQANSEHCYGHAGTLNCDKGQQGCIVAFPDPAYAISAGSQGRGGVFGSGRDSQDTFVAIDLQNVRCGGDVAGTLDTTRPSRGGGQAVAFTKAQRAHSTTDGETWVPGEVAPTFNCFDQGDTRATTVVAFTQNTRDEVRQINGDGRIAGALAANAGMKQTNYIAFANRTRDGIKVPEVMKDGVTPALTNPGDGGRSDAVNVACGMAVRRLTPRECERLQGFPDDYTAIEYRKKPAADGPRYKALGNSMAVPVMAWIGRRIQNATAHT